MSDTSIFEVRTDDVDVKNYTKIRTKCSLNDKVYLKIYTYSDNSPVTLNDWNCEFRCVLPKSQQIYSEADNITKNGNLLTISCDSFMTGEIGEVVGYIRLWNLATEQKSSYQIIIKVMPTIAEDEKVAETSLLSAMSSLDMTINRYIELKADLNGEITIGQVLLQNLKDENVIVTSTISNAQQINTTLTNTYNSANLLNNDLKNNINSATNLNGQVQTNISNLNSSIAVAKYYNNELKATTTTAQTLVNTLITENQLAGQQITTLQGFGDINVLIKMINDLTITQNSFSHLLDLIMDSNPLYWTDDNGVNVTDDSLNNIRI